MSKLQGQRTRRSRLPPITMDPTQLAEFAVTRSPRSPVIAGLLLHHHINGRALAEGSSELIDSLTHDLSISVQEDFRQLHLDVNVGTSSENRHLRPLWEIVDQLNTSFPSPTTGFCPEGLSPSSSELPTWDFNVDEDDDVHSEDATATEGYTEAWEYEDHEDFAFVHEGTAASYDRHENEDMSFGYSSAHDTVNRWEVHSEAAATSDPRDRHSDGASEVSSIGADRNRANEQVLLASMDPSLMAMGFAVRNRGANLNATVVGIPSSDASVTSRPESHENASSHSTGSVAHTGVGTDGRAGSRYRRVRDIGIQTDGLISAGSTHAATIVGSPSLRVRGHIARAASGGPQPSERRVSVEFSLSIGN